MAQRKPRPKPTLAIIGAGFVGLTTAIVLAERGRLVHLIEHDAARLEALKRGRAAFFEPGVDEALAPLVASGQIQAHATLDELEGADILFLCVGTPALPDGSADLQYLRAAVKDIGRRLSQWPRPPVIVTKSTVPPGTLRTVVQPLLQKAGAPGTAYGLASNPEFLKEGAALADARKPDRIVVGAMDPLAAAALKSLYRGVSSPYLATDPETAETVKYVANAFLATKIAFSNEAANLCESIGIDVYDVMAGVGLDARIGRHFLRAGVGFGGSCFPKDLSSLRDVARKHGVKMGILEAVLANNETQPLRAIEAAKELVGPLKGKRTALLGLSFKAATSDVRETRALPIYRALKDAGADVRCYDPIAGEAFRAYANDGVQLAPSMLEALDGADLCIVQTEWPEFRAVPAEEFVRRMRTPAVVDGRRALDGPSLLAAGVMYRAVGSGRHNGNHP